MADLFSNCTKLEHISVVTSYSLQVKVSGWVTDASLQLIGTHCPRLRGFFSFGNTKITDGKYQMISSPFVEFKACLELNKRSADHLILFSFLQFCPPELTG